MVLKDNYLWLEFSKFVSRINNKNTVTKKSTLKTVVIHNINSSINLKNSKNRTVNIMHKKEKRKFKEEKILDLHGVTRSALPEILENFCTQCIREEVRNVVIITGKGEEEIIKKATYEWLKSSPIYIISFAPILDSAKQSGAYTVKLRKK